jgi:hypothetical protein
VDTASVERKPTPAFHLVQIKRVSVIEYQHPFEATLQKLSHNEAIRLGATESIEAVMDDNCEHRTGSCLAVINHMLPLFNFRQPGNQLYE